MAAVKHQTRIVISHHPKSPLAPRRFAVACVTLLAGFEIYPRKRFTISGAEVLRPTMDGMANSRVVVHDYWLRLAGVDYPVQYLPEPGGKPGNILTFPLGGRSLPSPPPLSLTRARPLYFGVMT